jgi:hypothetical protein
MGSNGISWFSFDGKRAHGLFSVEEYRVGVQEAARILGKFMKRGGIEFEDFCHSRKRNSGIDIYSEARKGKQSQFRGGQVCTKTELPPEIEMPTIAASAFLRAESR